MNTGVAAIVLGVALVLVGVLGFVPNPIVSPTGFFAVNTVHNLVHILTGLTLMAGASNPQFGSAMALRIVGIAYAVIAVLGFFGGLLDFLAMNGADMWLHVGLAIVFLGAGFGLPKDQPGSA